jgi:hypothetical protein
MATDEALFSELEGDVPSLANQAATELDNIIIGRGGQVTAIRQFVTFLRNELQGSGVTSTQRMPVRATTFVVMNRAVSEAEIGTPPRNVGDVVQQVGHVVEILAKIGEHPLDIKDANLEEVQRMRSFCLAYSKSASRSQGKRNERPRNPFRS